MDGYLGSGNNAGAGGEKIDATSQVLHIGLLFDSVSDSEFMYVPVCTYNNMYKYSTCSQLRSALVASEV